MGKVIVDEEMRFDVIINGDKAQKELFDLERATKELTQSNKLLKAEKVRLKALGKEESAEYKKITATIKEKSAAIKVNETRMEALRGKIGITSLTMKQLRTEASRLKTLLYNMTPGSAEYLKLQADLKAVDARMKVLTLNTRAAEGSISRLANGFNKYFALGASFIATGTGMVLSMQKMIDYNAKLSDAQADVRKTTGLSKEGVDELSKSLGLMKTRTARVELLKIAEQAGRLGITGVKNLQDFVASANEIKVALGDDLSEEAIQEIGKLTNIYKVGEQTGKDFAGAMTAVGSAINEVSASGANQASFLVDYLKRQSGIAAQAKISADANIGYAATFDELGQSVEVSATAMNKVWLDMFENSAEYAKIAGVNVKDFSELLNTDANEAMFLFLEGLNGNNEGLSVMAEKLKDIEVGGARGVQALTALSGNTDLLRKRQKLANEALKEATSVTNEYNLKNENLAATIEKVQKKLIGIFTSEKIMGGLAAIVDWFAKFIGATNDADGSVTRFRERLIFAIKIVLAAAVAFVSYNAALKLTTFFTTSATQATTLYSIVNKASAITTGIARGGQLLLAAAYNLVTGNITRATAAMRLFNITTKLNPIGLLLGLLAAAATAFFLFRNKAKDAEGSLKQLNSEMEVTSAISSKLAEDYAKAATQLKSSIEPLISILENQNTSLETRKKAYQELINISPQFIGTVDEEYRATGKLRDVYKDLLIQMHNKLRAQAQEKVLSNYYDEEAEALNRLYEARKKLEQFRSDNKSDPYYNLKFGDEDAELVRKYNDAVQEYNVSLNNTRQIESYRAKQIESLTEKQKQYTEGSKEYIAIQEQINALIGSSPIQLTNEFKEPIAPLTPLNTENNSEPKYDISKELADLEKIYESKNSLKASLIKDSFEREKKLELLNFDERMKTLEAQKIKEGQFTSIDKNIESAANKGQEKTLQELLRLKTVWQEKNKAIDQQMLDEAKLYQNKLGSILENAIQDKFQREEKEFNRETTRRQTQHNLEMAALGENREAREQLQDQFDVEESARQEKHLRELIAQMQQIVSNNNFEGFSLELLSEEEKNQVLEFLDKLGLDLSELIAKKKGLTGGDGIDLGAAGGIDILGFSADQWKATFDNLDSTAGKIAAAQMAVQALSNAWSAYNNFKEKEEQEELRKFEKVQNQKEDKLQRQLDAGFINRRQYERSVDQLQKESDKKRADLEYKAAKRQYELNMTAAIGNAALAVLNGLQAKPFLPVGIAMGGLAAVLGGVQIAMMAKAKPVKGFEDGLYPVQREQDGKVFNARNGGKMRSGLVKKPTILVAEKDPEMIIDGGAWKQMDPGVKDSLYRELGRMGRVPGYEGGLYPQVVNGGSPPDYTGELMQVIYRNTSVMERNAAILERLEKDGVRATMVRNMENARQIKDTIRDYDKLRNANKR